MCVYDERPHVRIGEINVLYTQTHTLGRDASQTTAEANELINLATSAIEDTTPWCFLEKQRSGYKRIPLAMRCGGSGAGVVRIPYINAVVCVCVRDIIPLLTSAQIGLSLTSLNAPLGPRY